MKIRVYRKKEKRREGKGIFLSALLFFLLFPYIISSFSDVKKETVSFEDTPGQIFVREKKIWGGEYIPLEEYLVGMMAATIPAEYEMETLKAQAIILRSFCMNRVKKENGTKVIYDDELRDYYLTGQQWEELWKEKCELYFNKMQKAVKETNGIILVCEGDIVEPPFSRMSNGRTRDITEYVVYKEEYGYMKTVDCTEDTAAGDFVQYVEISRKEFESMIKKIVNIPVNEIDKIILYRDSNNYVKEIQIGEEYIDGEKFRSALGLVSSCYSLDKIGDAIEIQCKGKGHGFGFSQYEANQLALEGNEYKDLLKYFFSNITFEKV